MLTPKLRVFLIARALVVSEPSETRTVGGSADPDARAVTVIPLGLSPTRQVTRTTPLASALIASANSAIGRQPTGWSVTSLRLVFISRPAVRRAGGRREAATEANVAGSGGLCV